VSEVRPVRRMVAMAGIVLVRRIVRYDLWMRIATGVRRLRTTGRMPASARNGCSPRVGDSESGWRVSRVNPGTGYRIARGSIDVAGYAYGSASEASDDRHWD